MTAKEKELIAAVAAVLQSPRDRLGRLTDHRAAQDAMRKLAEQQGLFQKLPNGGTDAMDQAAMVLQAMIGAPVKSVGW